MATGDILRHFNRTAHDFYNQELKSFPRRLNTTLSIVIIWLEKRKCILFYLLLNLSLSSFFCIFYLSFHDFQVTFIFSMSLLFLLYFSGTPLYHIPVVCVVQKQCLCSRIRVLLLGPCHPSTFFAVHSFMFFLVSSRKNLWFHLSFSHLCDFGKEKQESWTCCHSLSSSWKRH